MEKESCYNVPVVVKIDHYNFSKDENMATIVEKPNKKFCNSWEIHGIKGNTGISTINTIVGDELLQDIKEFGLKKFEKRIKSRLHLKPQNRFKDVKLSAQISDDEWEWRIIEKDDEFEFVIPRTRRPDTDFI